MAFKRVGDDFGAIKVQKKFRVSELLLEDIPEDEATLMKNGRFACLVCRHNPVFDTVAVLSIHRQGKKHLANAKIRLERLREDTELRQKRAHENYLKNLKPELDQGQEKAPLLTLTQKRKELALNNSPRSVTSAQPSSDQGPDKPDKQRNVPFFQSTVAYDSSRSVTSSQSSDQPVKEKNVPFFQSRVPLDSKFLQTRKMQGGIVVPQPDDVSDGFSDNQKTATSKADSDLHAVSSCSKKGKCTAKTVTPAEISAEERAKREHIARLTRNGWIRDWDGKWKKDENVEFDSDEDEPPLIP